MRPVPNGLGAWLGCGSGGGVQNCHQLSAGQAEHDHQKAERSWPCQPWRIKEK